jgi:acyl carrier protein
MTKKEVLNSAFSESLGIPLASVKDELKYNSIPEWDSVAHMVLVSVLEEKFDVMLDTNDILDMSSVAQAQVILEKHGILFV